MRSNERCQCLSSCFEPPLKGEAFCKTHLNHCPREAPLSGSEPKYQPDLWNKNQYIRKSHNCFSYGMNRIDNNQIKECQDTSGCNTPFHQPGSVSGYPKFNGKDPKTCPNMIGRIMGDNNTILPSAFEIACPTDHYKIALIVDEDQDYHFLRQDAPKKGEKIGYFSQKSGSLPVTNKDATGHRIFDVELANHNFTNKYKSDSLNYDRFCGYFCVPIKSLYMKVGGYRNTRRSKAKKAKGKR